MEEFWLQLGQCGEEIIQSFVLLTRLDRIDHFICEVDISLNQVHIRNELLVLRRHSIAATFRASILLLSLVTATSARISLSLSRLCLLYLWRELDTLVPQCVIYLGEDWKDVRVLVEAKSPLLDKVSNPHLNLFWHFLVVHHCNELLHEGRCADLFVERRSALVHNDIEQAKRKEDDFERTLLKTALNLLCDNSSILLATVDCLDNGID